MTTNARLKKKIRELAAASGESYQKMRSKVMAARAGSPPPAAAPPPPPAAPPAAAPPPGTPSGDPEYGDYECPQCRAEYGLLIGDGDPRCTICGYTAKGEAAASEYVETVMRIDAHRQIKDGGEDPVRDCPECGSNAMIDQGAFLARLR